MCDIAAAVDARDFASARTIYANGQNSLRSDGTARTLQGELACLFGLTACLTAT